MYEHYNGYQAKFNYMYDNSLQITKVANGYIVVTPWENPMPDSRSEEIAATMRGLATAIKDIKRNIEGDDIMAKIKEEAMKENSVFDGISLSGAKEAPVAGNIHIFPRFDEAVRFLKGYYDELSKPEADELPKSKE